MSIEFSTKRDRKFQWETFLLFHVLILLGPVSIYFGNYPTVLSFSNIQLIYRWRPWNDHLLSPLMAVENLKRNRKFRRKRKNEIPTNLKSKFLNFPPKLAGAKSMMDAVYWHGIICCHWCLHLFVDFFPFY